MPARATATLPPFNAGRALRVVRVSPTQLGVVDQEWSRVWVEHELVSRADVAPRGVDALPEVALPRIPAHYGAWVTKSIGGVSATVRREGVLRARPAARGPITLFATRAPSAAAVPDALRAVGAARVVATGVDAEYGHVAEIAVARPDDLAHVAARVARAGAAPMLEDPDVDAMRSLGVERLDRIDAAVVEGDEEGEEAHERGRDEEEPPAGAAGGGRQRGLKRGRENWCFPWMPAAWTHVPITWDHMVQNYYDAPIDALPPPLQQHVARRRLADGAVPPAAARWREAEAPPHPEELAAAVDGGGGAAAGAAAVAGRRTVLRHAALEAALGAGERAFDAATLAAWGLDGLEASSMPRYLARGADGRWYRPVNPRAAYERHAMGGGARARRAVSAALRPEQSTQLVEAFYHLVVERVDDPEVAHALELVLFHYMRGRGYTARWMGKYRQLARHLGNGRVFRKFNATLVQYGVRDAIPDAVVSRLMGVDGRIRARGNKGSRSKYKEGGRRYRPARRLARTAADEAGMAARARAAVRGRRGGGSGEAGDGGGWVAVGGARWERRAHVCVCVCACRPPRDGRVTKNECIARRAMRLPRGRDPRRASARPPPPPLPLSLPLPAPPTPTRGDRVTRRAARGGGAPTRRRATRRRAAPRGRGGA